MHCVIVEFQYGDDFDRAHVAEIAREARRTLRGHAASPPKGLHDR